VFFWVILLILLLWPECLRRLIALGQSSILQLYYGIQTVRVVGKLIESIRSKYNSYPANAAMNC
jgi:uncharacterized membrane protein YhaH (DUF805 family)